MNDKTMNWIVPAVFVLLFVVTIALFLEPAEKVSGPVEELPITVPESKPTAVEMPNEPILGATKATRSGESLDLPERTRGPARTGSVTLRERIDRFVPHFENGPAEPIAFDVELLGETFPVALTEFERVPGSAGSGVFFGYVEGEPHSRVSWAFHGEAEVGEIRIHGQDTLKIIPTGGGREHRVLAWDPLELKRCAQCLAQAQ